jgi:hypothetical protein
MYALPSMQSTYSVEELVFCRDRQSAAGGFRVSWASRFLTGSLQL